MTPNTQNIASVPWRSFPHREEGRAAKAWHKHHVSYTENANALQNLDIWIPNTDDETQPHSVETLPSRRPGIWIIYIHGGAWRDPLVDSASFTATVEHLLQDHVDALESIAGIASLNYSLSPHPHHPTHPSPPIDPEQPVDPSRQAVHPDHITDVLSAIRLLQLHAIIKHEYILMGHSCGATLAFQVATNHTRWGQKAAALDVKKPKAIIGLNGLYDLPALIENPGSKHEHLIPVYDAFTRLAFKDESTWQGISPVSIEDWATEWPEGVLVVLVQSKEDNLVPYGQLELMRTSLSQNSSASDTKEICEMEASGDHNELWKSGDRLAQIVAAAVSRLQR